MRKFSVYFLVFVTLTFMMLFTYGCSSTKTPNNNDDSEHDFKEELKEFCDLDMTSKPTRADMETIRVDMPFNEVVEKIGKPHNLAKGFSASGYFCWITSDDYYYVIELCPDLSLSLEDAGNMSMSEYYSTSTVNSVLFGKPLSETESSD